MWSINSPSKGMCFFADRWTIWRRRKHIPFDGELVDHIDQVWSGHRAVSITNRILGLHRLGAADVEPVVLAKPAVPGVTVSTGGGKIVEPYLQSPCIAGNRKLRRLWDQPGYGAARADAIE